MPNLIITEPEQGALLVQPSKTSFYYSFSLLPSDERHAMHSVYAFCRYAGDIVDEDEEIDVTAPELRVIRKRERLNSRRVEVERYYRGEYRHRIRLPLSAE